MLKSLYIENLAVISRAELELTGGFNVFTGETGAGKTLLIGAVSAVMGQRVSRDIIRTGESRALVTAVFGDLPEAVRQALSDLGYPPEEDGSLMISRIIKPESAECRVNGRPATVSVLKSLAPLLIDLHGQRDSARLLSPDYHLSLVDQYGGLEARVREYHAAYVSLRNIQEELEGLITDEAERIRRQDLLEYQVNEIEEADLTPGEEEELDARREVMRNSGKIADALTEAREILRPSNGEEAGLDELFSMMVDALNTASRFIPDLADTASRMQDVSYELNDLGYDLTGYLDEVEYSPRELDELEERLSLIHALKTKYGASIPAILEYGRKAREELDAMEHTEERREKLQKAAGAAKKKAQALADALTEARRDAGTRFCAAVEQELTFLDMPSVRLTAGVEKKDLGPSGQDAVELLMTANPGEPPRPLHKIASGGELSRVMLSIKNVLAGGENVTSIFDEVDTGVSGSAADKIGQKLAEASAGRQVLCVTHLAQVAAYADQHFFIRKRTAEGRASTEVLPLPPEERAAELARIVGGEHLSDTVLQAAREMIAEAEQKKLRRAIHETIPDSQHGTGCVQPRDGVHETQQPDQRGGRSTRPNRIRRRN